MPGLLSRCLCDQDTHRRRFSFMDTVKEQTFVVLGYQGMSVQGHPEWSFCDPIEHQVPHLYDASVAMLCKAVVTQPVCLHFLHDVNLCQKCQAMHLSSDAHMS